MNKKPPLVSVICLCYNHEAYVQEAIHSVLDQSYENIELIVVNDASTDNSSEVLAKLQKEHPSICVINNTENRGNCSSFNIGFRQSKGEFIIDLAADDLLETNRISKGINEFQTKDKDWGVHYGRVLLIDQSGKEIGQEQMAHTPKSGDVYRELIQYYMVNPVSMMTRREVLERMNGYDETLEYEDFDFWIRSARHFKYQFTDDVLARKRILTNSHSKKQTNFLNSHQRSTLQVIRKIYQMNREPAEHHALRRRILYECKQCIRTGNIHLIAPYLQVFFKSII